MRQSKRQASVTDPISPVHLQVKTVKCIGSFPSGSGIEFIAGRFFIIGDDARDILILDKKLKVVQRVLLFAGKDKRISKAKKPDLEATATVVLQHKLHLLALGSGSRPQRCMAVLMNVADHAVEFIDMAAFFTRLPSFNVAQTNIEGATAVGNDLVLANRGNKRHPGNQLLVTTSRILREPAAARVRCYALDLTDDAPLAGVSGLAYAKDHDCLCLTASTEDTDNSYEDGNIGDSYLGFIFHASQVLRSRKQRLACNVVINLAHAHKAFEGQKIESLCIKKWTPTGLTLCLVSDNDAGQTRLFKIRLHFAKPS